MQFTYYDSFKKLSGVKTEKRQIVARRPRQDNLAKPVIQWGRKQNHLRVGRQKKRTKKPKKKKKTKKKNTQPPPQKWPKRGETGGVSERRSEKCWRSCNERGGGGALVGGGGKLL